MEEAVDARRLNADDSDDFCCNGSPDELTELTAATKDKAAVTKDKAGGEHYGKVSEAVGSQLKEDSAVEIGCSDTQSNEMIVLEDAISRTSTLQGDMCRICHCLGDDERLISPCECSGSMKYVHQTCLQKWIKSSDAKKCELCGFPYNMTSSVKPFTQWKKLNMTSVERRKVLCSVTFHVVAITCVIWSLYVLIDRTTQEIQEGNLNWPFWTKLVVVAIGFTGGLVFMYVQCKMYVQLFRKWKQFNRVIYIQSMSNPEIRNATDGSAERMDGSGDTLASGSDAARRPKTSKGRCVKYSARKQSLPEASV